MLIQHSNEDSRKKTSSRKLELRVKERRTL